MADYANPAALHQRAHDIGADGDAAHLLDLGPRDGLAVGDQRERLEQRARVTRRPLLPQGLEPVRHRRANLDPVSASDFLDLEAATFVILGERVEPAADRRTIGRIAPAREQLDELLERQRTAGCEQRRLDDELYLRFIHGFKIRALGFG